MTGSAIWKRTVLQTLSAARDEWRGDSRSLELRADASFTAKLHGTIEAVEPLWRRMQREGLCTVYQSLEWTNGLVRDLIAASGGRLLIVEVREGPSGRAVMLLPLVLRRQNIFRVIEWLDLGVCDYAYPILGHGVRLTAKQAAAAWAAVKSVLPAADLILIDGVLPQMSGIANPLASLPGAAISDQQAYGIDIQGDPSTLLKRQCGSSFDRNIRKSERKLLREGEVKFVAAQGSAQVAVLFDVLIEQRLRRFRTLGRADLLQQPHVARFYRQMALDSVSGGPVRLFGVSVGGEWIATAYGLVHGDAFHGILLAMGDDRWRKASPGLYLIAEIVKWARGEQLTYFDMTVGSLAYKAAMGARSQDLLTICEAMTPLGYLFLAARRCILLSRAWLKRHPKMFDRLRSLRQRERRLRARLTATGDGFGHETRSDDTDV